MSTTNLNDDASDPYRDQLAELADEFLDALRAGELPDIEAYAARIPELSDRIREMLQAISDMEEVVSNFQSTPTPPLSVERTIIPERLGPYHLQRLLGRGGMGIVFEAQHETLKRHVALKVLRPELVRDRRYRERFQREARAAGGLQHPNIVAVFEVGQSQGFDYLAMQYIRGPALSEIIADLRELRSARESQRAVSRELSKRLSRLHEMGIDSPSTAAAPPAPGGNDSPQSTKQQERYAVGSDGSEPSSAAAADEAVDDSLPPHLRTSRARESSSAANESNWSDQWQGKVYFRRIARLMAQAADAIDYAHREHIIHRDLKPSNMLVDERGVLWITDFGLAKVEASNLTESQDVLGTFLYMAPEQFSGGSESRSDVYSLGMTLYELLTLQPAFNAKTHGELIHQVLHTTPSTPRSIDGKIPRDLELICLRATAKDPAERYRTAADLRDELLRYTRGEPLKYGGVSQWQKLWAWACREPALAGALSLLLVALVAWFISLNISNRLLAGKVAEVLESQGRLALVAAGNEVSRGNPGNIVGYLQAVPEGDRNVAWRYLSKHVDMATAIVGGSVEDTPFNSPTLNVAISRDGLVAACPFQGGVSIYDTGITQPGTPPQKRVYYLEGVRLGELHNMSFSPDGHYLAYTPLGETTSILDYRTGEIRKLPENLYDIPFPKFSPDSRYLALISNERAVVLDVATLQVLREDRSLQIGLGVWFDPQDSNVLVRRERTAVRRWNIRSGEVTDLATAPAGFVWLYYGQKLALMISDDRPQSQAVLRAADPRTQRTIWEVGAAQIINWQITVSPDESQVVFPTNFGKVILYRTVDGARQELLGHHGEVRMLSFDPTSRWMVSCGLDRTVRIWDTQRPSHRISWQYGDEKAEAIDRPLSVTVTPDQQTIIAYSNDTVRILRADTLELLHTLYPGLWGAYKVAVSPDSRQLAVVTEGGQIQIWNLAEAQLEKSFPLHGYQINAPRFSRDGKTLGYATELGEFCLLDLSTGQVTVLHRDKLMGGALAFHPQTEEVAFGGLSMNIHLLPNHQPGTPQNLGSFLSSLLNLQFSPDGRYLAGTGRSTQIRYYDWQDKGREQNWVGHVAATKAGKFTPDSRQFISIGEDRTLRVWEPGRTAPTMTLDEDYFLEDLVDLSILGTQEPEQILISRLDYQLEHLFWGPDPPTPEFRQNAKLLTRVAWWFKYELSLDAVLRELSQDPLLTPEERIEAQQIARRWRGSPRVLLRAAQPLLDSPTSQLADYQRAKSYTAEALGLWNNAAARLQHGISLYRCGEYAEARKLLVESERELLAENTIEFRAYSVELRNRQLEDRCANQLYLAATLHQLGEAEPARQKWQEAIAGYTAEAPAVTGTLRDWANQVAQLLGLEPLP